MGLHHQVGVWYYQVVSSEGLEEFRDAGNEGEGFMEEPQGQIYD